MMLILQYISLKGPKPNILQRIVLILTFGCLASPCSIGLSQDFDASQLEFFETSVRPLLVEHCQECHGAADQPLKGGLSVLSRQALVEGGETGPAIIPEHPEESLLIDAINYGDVYEMPPDTKMSEEAIATLEKWVAMGAPWPTETDHVIAAESQFNIHERKTEHWCWKPVQNLPPPKVKDTQWPKDAIDNFVLSKLEDAQLNPALPANRRTLIRRLYFDIIGLPPTPQQIEAYLNDTSSNATAKVVDQLLASPRFGERWARHWMDLTRYAETCGHEFDYPLPHAYKYRDYLIRAFNEDVSYDDFIREHIAGDLLQQPRQHITEKYNESILGTGFWFLGEATHAPVDVKGDEAGRVDNQIDVMTKTFLGLTVACARCHDHKFDAISTQDYYAMAGFLQSSRRQLAMLDPAENIQNALLKTEQSLRQAEQLFPEIQTHIQNLDSKKLAKTIESALLVLRSDPAWNQPPTFKIQGETLKSTNKVSGKTEVQNLAARGEFRWEGDKQLLWIDGKPGEQLDFEITIPDSGIAEFEAELKINYTQAVDYATVQMYIDDQPIGDVQDLYDQEVTVQLRNLGRLSLKPGKRKISFKIAGKGDMAKPRYGVGIDYIEFLPIQKQDDSTQQLLQKLAQENKLDTEQIKRWVSAIQSETIKSPTHPLHDLHKASREQTVVDGSYAKNLENQHQQQTKRHQEYLNQSELFESFDQGIPTDWFQAGSTFASTNDNSFVSAADSMVAPEGIANGGKFGRQFFGVLYSPTFEIDTDQIHIRARGDNTTVRLIIDGFVMDIYNALLFNGCRTGLNQADEYRWYTLGGDLRNYRGHKAHLEFIDHGHGFAEIDEIRFSNRGSAPIPSKAIGHLATDAPKTVPLLARSLATYIIQSAANCQTDDDSRSLDFMIENDLLERPFSEEAGIVAEFKALLQEAKSAATKAPAPQLAVAMIDGTPEDEFVFVRGNHKAPGEIAPRRFLEAFEPSKTKMDTSQGSGRMQLANRIASPSNPLTARVAVNRVWHHMFGKGIVPSVDNFGVLGQSPTHPKLLDFLAINFVQNGWSIKRLIRRIALSRTYQMSSQTNPKANRIDPDNNLLHRSRIKRLQGESIRDAMLSCSNEIDLTMHGPSIPIHLTSFMGGRGRPGRNGPLDGAKRRSVYIETRRNFLSPMMLAFDTPIPFNSIGRRNQSNVPAQALILMNEPFVMDQAKKWGEKLAAEDGPAKLKISNVYQTALGRAPTEQEMNQNLQFLKQQSTELGLNSNEAMLGNAQLWADFCHVIFNVKEFIYIY